MSRSVPDMQVRYGTRTRSVAPTPRLPRVFSFSLLLLFFFLCCLCSLALGGIRNIGKCGAYSSCDDLVFLWEGRRRTRRITRSSLLVGSLYRDCSILHQNFPCFLPLFRRMTSQGLSALHLFFKVVCHLLPCVVRVCGIDASFHGVVQCL